MNKNQNAVHIYNKIAEDYAKTYDAIDGEEDLIFLQKFLAALAPKSSILDIGCGTGFSAGFFVQNGMSADGIDLAESMIAIAKRNYPNITFAVANILEYAPAVPVDAVWAGYSLFHFTQKDFKKALEKVKTYLKPSGVFGLVMQGGEGEIEVPEPFAPEETIYLHLYSEHELQEILERHGFEIMEIARKSAKEAKEFSYNKLLFIVKPRS
ncbi:MAG: class I SAM-dependent methyltransferase [bacterium]|nr:class I SAM-dependent methyltransferase [bacterium]